MFQHQTPNFVLFRLIPIPFIIDVPRTVEGAVTRDSEKIEFRFKAGGGHDGSVTVGFGYEALQKKWGGQVLGMQ